MNLTTEQTRAAHAIRDTINGKTGKRTFVLHGVAGTGKSTVLCEIAREFPEARLCAYTGKAAANLRAKSGLKAVTVHSVFYRLIDKGYDEKTKKRILYFDRVHGRGALTGEVILLDECSMIDKKTAEDLLQSGAIIIAVGDPGQLPPVFGAQFFDRPDATLTEIHRQALDNPIIRQAHNMREHGVYESDGEEFQVVKKLKAEQLLAADAILCWRNATRHRLNAKMRHLLGYDLPYPCAGERVLCLKNAHKYGIYNGCVYELARAFQPDDTTISLLIDGVELDVPKCRFVSEGGSLDDFDDDDFISAFDYGFCLTVHKSQGSEWDNVVLVDENHKHARRQWAYTAITRAAKRIIIQG